uniref:Galectin n=1 Tax=Rhabditophanes sp. KR3021 TaxID=114890 RepID=A0AC35U5Z7_9BILA
MHHLYYYDAAPSSICVLDTKVRTMHSDYDSDIKMEFFTSSNRPEIILKFLKNQDDSYVIDSKPHIKCARFNHGANNVSLNGSKTLDVKLSMHRGFAELYVNKIKHGKFHVNCYDEIVGVKIDGGFWHPHCEILDKNYV